jgi:hypothetical protein
MRKVTKVDTQPDMTASSSGTQDHRISNFQHLLDQCVHSEEQHRPTSAVIIDSIPSIGKDFPPPTPLLSQAACGLIEWDTRGATANARKKARMGLSSQLLLCNRLLLAGCIPGNSHVENRPLLEHAVSFLNRNLEALGSSPANGDACPGWKGSAVERLISFLRKHAVSEMPQGRDEHVVPYDIGSVSRSSFHGTASAIASRDRQTTISSAISCLSPQRCSLSERHDVLGVTQLVRMFPEIDWSVLTRP